MQSLIGLTQKFMAGLAMMCLLSKRFSLNPQFLLRRQILPYHPLQFLLFIEVPQIHLMHRLFTFSQDRSNKYHHLYLHLSVAKVLT